MAVEIAAPRLRAGGPGLKRLVDILGAAAGLILTAPILVLISLWIKVSMGGKVLFRQIRIGKDGKSFSLLKFSTMCPMTEAEFQRFLERHPAQKMEYEQFQKLARDPRLTAAGSFLRRTSLDELPQLWNVLKGEMSLVGPRPFLPEQIEIYGRALSLYVRVRPGITGLWQVSGRNCLSFQERVDCDISYVENWSLILDISILVRTAGAVLSQRGAY
jgi:lipopolysaccharide/colanic/teichoic acid biosynthesis glycosyltransferase